MTSTTVHPPLTSAFAFLLGDLLNWVTQKQKVAYSTDNGATIRTGTLRHLVVGPDNFNFSGHRDADVRDSWVRITTDTGVEDALPVTQIVELMSLGGFGPVDPGAVRG